MLRFVFASISRSVGICYHQIELISLRTMIVKLRWVSININSAANWVNSPAPFPLIHTHTHIHNNKLSNKTILPLGSVSIRSCHIQRTLYLHMASCRCTWQIPKAAAVDAAVAVAVAIAVAAQNML